MEPAQPGVVLRNVNVSHRRRSRQLDALIFTRAAGDRGEPR